MVNIEMNLHIGDKLAVVPDSIARHTTQAYTNYFALPLGTSHEF
jgi:hypothetical protein